MKILIEDSFNREWRNDFSSDEEFDSKVDKTVKSILNHHDLEGVDFLNKQYFDGDFISINVMDKISGMSFDFDLFITDDGKLDGWWRRDEDDLDTDWFKEAVEKGVRRDSNFYEDMLSATKDYAMKQKILSYDKEAQRYILEKDPFAVDEWD